MRKIASVAAAIIVACSIRVQAQEDQAKSRVSSITVSGVTTREVVPDIAILRFVVSAEKPTTLAATEEMSRNAQAVIAEIKSQGLDPRDLKTTVTITPVYDEKRIPQEQFIKRTLRGYVARNTLTVRLRETARAGVLARSLMDKGANAFEGIEFVVSDDQRRTDELKIGAIKEAVRKAKLYTEAAEVRLGRVLSIDPESDEGTGVADLPRRSAAPGQVSSIAIPVEPGVQQLSARISITWELLP